MSAGTNGSGQLSAELLEGIRQFDTCTIANAIERFGVRLRNEGFSRPGLRSLSGDDARLVGYAATFKIRSSDPPMVGTAYFDRTDWWKDIAHLPVPRVAVFEDLEGEYSTGSSMGEVHAAILKAFQCAGVITNGAVRDVPAVQRMDFALFARTAAVSHAYTHIVEYGTPVNVFGLEIRNGDLLYADCHGVVSIPIEIAAKIPEAASQIRSKERRIIDLCQSADFSPEKLREVITSTL